MSGPPPPPPPPDPLDLLGNLTQCDFPPDTPVRSAWLHVVAEKLDPWFFEIRDQLMVPTWSITTKRFYESNVRDTLQEILMLISAESTTSEPYLQSRQMLTASRRLVSYTDLAAFNMLGGAANDNASRIPDRLQICPPPPPPPPPPP